MIVIVYVYLYLWGNGETGGWGDKGMGGWGWGDGEKLTVNCQLSTPNLFKLLPLLYFAKFLLSEPSITLNQLRD